MHSCAQSSAGEGQYLKMLSFSRQAFSRILTSIGLAQHSTAWPLQGTTSEVPRVIFPLLCGVTSFFPPREREAYLTSITAEPDQYFLFHSNCAFVANDLGISPCCSPAGTFIWSPGRQRAAGGRDARDPGLHVAQPHSARPVCGRGCSHVSAISSAAAGGV